MTNADKIRQMTDAELAVWMTKFATANVIEFIKWLRKEAEDDT